MWSIIYYLFIYFVIHSEINWFLVQDENSVSILSPRIRKLAINANSSFRKEPIADRYVEQSKIIFWIKYSLYMRLTDNILIRIIRICSTKSSAYSKLYPPNIKTYRIQWLYGTRDNTRRHDKVGQLFKLKYLEILILLKNITEMFLRLPCYSQVKYLIKWKMI